MVIVTGTHNSRHGMQYEAEDALEGMLVRQHAHRNAAAAAAGAEEQARASSAKRLSKLALAESTKARLAKLAPAEHTRSAERLSKLAVTEHTRARLARLTLAEHDFLQQREFGSARRIALAELQRRPSC